MTLRLTDGEQEALKARADAEGISMQEAARRAVARVRRPQRPPRPPDIWTKAAALLQSIVKNHALVDGNKRLGWLATAVFLEIDVAAGQSTVDAIAERLRQLAT